jgi:glycosyltransferase involved in cell wall biosynthesis
MSDSSPLVSCLMVTLAGRQRLKLLKQSIASYLAQTYENRELVIIVDNRTAEDRGQLLSYLSSLGRPDIRCYLPDCKLSLGALRNLSVERAKGDILCLWDDDDLSHPERLKSQLRFLIENRLDAVLLTDYLHIFPHQSLCYWEHWHDKRIGGLHATLMMVNGHRVRYAESGPYSQQGEDTNLIARLKGSFKLGLFEAPAFYYLYFFHGHNTWGLAHHRSLAKQMAVSREKLISNKKYLIDGIKEVPGFQLPRLQFMEREGPLFLWAHFFQTGPE